MRPMRLAPRADSEPGFIEAAGGLFVAAESRTAQMLGQTAEEAQLLQAEDWH